VSAAFELFGPAWIALVFAAVALSWPGVLVVARGQAMVAIAAAECAAAGAAAAMAVIGWLGEGHLHGDWRIHAGAVLGGVLGTAAAWRAGSERAAWLFAAAGAASLLLLARSPYGMHDLQAIQSSNALLAGPFEAIAFGLLALGGAIVVALHHRELRLLAVDPEHARACGLRPRTWQLVIGGWLGLVLSLAVSVQGVLVAVAFLIAPSLVAGALARALWPVLVIAPLLALAAAIGGIAIAHGAAGSGGGGAGVCAVAACCRDRGASASHRQTRPRASPGGLRRGMRRPGAGVPLGHALAA